MEVGCQKNPDDEGEGENVKHSEDLVGIENTVTHDSIKVKPEPSEMKSKKYLRRFNRQSSTIPNHVLEQIEQYGLIQNVLGDGNCGFYSVMNGLEHVGIEFEEDINLNCKAIYDYINKNKNKLLLNMQFRRRNKDEYIESEILK